MGWSLGGFGTVELVWATADAALLAFTAAGWTLDVATGLVGVPTLLRL